MKKSLIALALIFSSVSAFSQNTTQCAPMTEDHAKALFDRWNDSLKTKNPDEVLKNYATDAVLLATLEGKPLKTPEAIRGYFVEFLKKSPQGKIVDRHIEIHCNVVYDAGTYDFTLTEKGKTKVVPARYTFVYEHINGQWVIDHHHSSLKP
jgi:uncharacterized protein (TIGR02246 family)